MSVASSAVMPCRVQGRPRLSLTYLNLISNLEEAAEDKSCDAGG